MHVDKRLTIALLLLSLTVSAQKKVTHQSLSWYGYFFSLHFNDKWYWQTELQERHFIAPVAQHQFLVRTHVHRAIGKSGWEASAGMCVFLQSQNEPEAVNKLIVPELRPHLEIAYKQKLKHVTLDHRYRTEARFFHGTDSARTVLEDGFEYGNFRFRYRLQATFPVWKIDEQRSLKIKVSDELHLNVGNKIVKNVYEQNRLYGGIAVDALPDLTFELGYLNWFQQRPNGDFYNRHILRFTVFHNVRLKLFKKKKEAIPG